MKSNNEILSVEITSHPIYKWISNKSHLYNFKELSNLCDILKEEKKFSYNYRYVIQHLTNYLNNKVETCRKSSSFYRSSYELIDLIPIYEKLFLYDKNKKTSIWDVNTISTLDSFIEGRELFAKLNINYLKNKNYKQGCIDFYFEQIEKMNSSFLNDIEYTQKEELIKKIHNNLLRYNNKFDWQTIFKNNITLLTANIAKEFNYEIKEIELKKLFNNTLLLSESLRNKSEQNHIDRLSNEYSEILLMSNFFKNTLSPAKNIRLAISNTFNITYKNNENNQLYGKEIFINNVIAYPGYAFANLKSKIEKKEMNLLMGKNLLTPEEYDIFIQKRKEKEENKIKVKKMKI